MRVHQNRQPSILITSNYFALKLFPWQKHKAFFNSDQQSRIVEAIQTAEQQTSGEVRVFVESKCSYMDALDRAKEIFFNLQMNKTALRNAVLFYIAVGDRQTAIFADEGIHQKTGDDFWQNTVETMLQQFSQRQLVDGLIQSVLQIGASLQQHFPYDKDTDKNELPDDIVFGK